MKRTSSDGRHRSIRFAVSILVAVALLGVPSLSLSTPAGSSPAHVAAKAEMEQVTPPAGTPVRSLTFPLRGAFYYPWYPAAWTQQGIFPYTEFTPTRGFYDGGDPEVIAGHIADMQYGNIQVGIVSWWGQGSREDLRMPELLSAARGTSFSWAIYYENEGTQDPSAAKLQADLVYLRDHYAHDPSYARIEDRFVVFVYGGRETCEMTDRWAQANTVDAYIVLKVFPGYRDCRSQPDGWHQYAPALSSDQQAQDSYTISPGFHLYGEPERLPRDIHRWQEDVRAMVASGAQWQLITTFNEWGEGTAVESATQWASPSGYGAYLDVLHNNGEESLQGGASLTGSGGRPDPYEDKQKRPWLVATTVSCGRKRRDSNPRSQP